MHRPVKAWPTAFAGGVKGLCHAACMLLAPFAAGLSLQLCHKQCICNNELCCLTLCAAAPEGWLCNRYLDMIVTDGVRDTFRKRSKMMSTIRHMLEQQSFLEVETPVLESTAGCCCHQTWLRRDEALQLHVLHGILQNYIHIPLCINTFTACLYLRQQCISYPLVDG